ncbi:DUF3488 domain-containing transglutaminase family protein [Thalassotalea sp. M1531]|uniref:DUF3488 domain-containing transglutaminase family protein n=1 Tax=Thalassotalea algicola TaxID=2716224 RepID=A0A7Y0Q629_9GAMM|nr:DUF3488 and transglutaminase-like domain-containing protein [Thalassotalea algicola]NMP31564.1 DUF3488 domain-containing transglutaminase family protein [Thalassotalea algicola]
MSETKPFLLNKSLHLHLLLVQLSTVALFANELTAWMLAIIALSFLWQFTQLAVPKRTRQHHSVSTPKLVTVLFALAGAGVIVVNSKSLGLLLAMVHLICFAYGIKSLEIKSRKDFYIIILIGLFLHACAFIFIQSIWYALVVLTVILLNLALLYRIFSVNVAHLKSYLSSLKLLAFSVPFAVALFVFFPRLSPFWQVPLANTAKTGLGSDVQPGDIAKLALSDALAFRVEFAGKAPSKSQMYWRAMTMSYYDGKKWSRNNGNRLPFYLMQKPNINYLSGDTYQYQVMAEASNRSWLFSLDTARLDNNKITQLADFSLISDKPITKTVNYQVVSFANAGKELNLANRAKRFYLRIPEDSNPKLQRLGQELRQRFNDKQQIIDHVLNQFRQQPYFYTLEPPVLVDNSLDQFYFDTQTGFCEHYASTFAFLMRAAGIPARLVTGYLGGEYNQQGNYYSIYQYDAHAWTEVWLEGQGWVSVDPTSAVSPERVSDDMSNALRQQRVNIAGAFSWQAFSTNALIAKLKMQIEAIDYQWNRLVLSYTVEKQTEFLKTLLGQGRLWKAALVMLLTFVLVVGLLWYRDLRPKQLNRRSNWQLQFDKLFIQLSKIGITREPSQLPLQMINDIEKVNRSLAVDYQQLCLNYERLSYSQLNAKDNMAIAKQFIEQCKKFNKQLKRL